jgi:gliding motility-associated-like protein
MTSDTLEVGSYDIKVSTINIPYVSESNYVTCFKPEPPYITIPNVFTPNNDGTNDLFVIRNLTLYSHRKVIVHNRWGDLVFESDQYNNNWDGGNLPDGVYYGIVEIIKNNQVIRYPFNVTILNN